MMKDQKKNLMIAMGLVANAMTAWAGVQVATAQASTVGPAQDSSPAAAPAELNRASLAAMEKSYLAVPHICKARSAAFDAIHISPRDAALEFAAYAALHA